MEGSTVQEVSASTFFNNGFRDLVSVIPPGATLTPTSTISLSQVGKVPGLKGPNGLWHGYDWRKHVTTADDVRQWTQTGANIGLKADRFPAVDIDCTDERLAATLQSLVVRHLGPTACRTGRHPKVLLPYRTEEPFGRMRLWIRYGGETHLVEVLGSGQQYLVHGIHPGTMQPYKWDRDTYHLRAQALPLITRDQADAMLDELARAAEMMGGICEREGDGRPSNRLATSDQAALAAPSIEELRKVVSLIPNDNDNFPARSDYIKMAYAIKAAAAGDDEEGYAIFADWAARWEGNDRFERNDPEVVRADWKRARGPFEVGFRWLAELAREHGYNDAAVTFDAILGSVPPEEVEERAPYLSDQWLAEEIVRDLRGELRYVPQRGQWIVWSGSHWQPDAELLAEDAIKRKLASIANKIIRRGSTDQEKAAAIRNAKAICSADKASAVRRLAQSDRNIAVSMSQLDHDLWIINTPAGVVDLRTGRLKGPDPDALCTRRTSVAPDESADCPRWLAFLDETTGGDLEMIGYLKRLAGYFLTGSTREEQLTFIWGHGGNGKSVFLNTISYVLGDYATVAAFDTFTASTVDRHTTELAMLDGARLVTASETSAGKRWDEAKIKSLTGGDPVTARFMRQDNFIYRPQFKLLFAGNHKPEMRNVGAAMLRRIQMVPFVRQPAEIDRELEEKLRREAPAILRWMIEGCLEWQRDGLKPPATVLSSTSDYFTDEDAVGRWIAECVELDADEDTETQRLYASWRQWSHENGEYTGSLKRLVSALDAKGFERGKATGTRRSIVRGVKLREQSLTVI